MKINFDKLRRVFFEKCTKEVYGELIIHMTPNQLFNWLKDYLTPKKRSLSQNNALHLYFEQLSEQLNNAGYTFTNVLGIELKFKAILIKESIWKPTQKEMFGFESTTKLTTEMINELIDVFSLEFGKKGIYVEFPSFQTFLNKLDEERLK